MEREVKIITESGTYKFRDNYELIFKNNKGYLLSDCDITCGNNCKIICGSRCNITCEVDCYIKAGEGSNLIATYRYNKTFKRISKDEEFIWWYVDMYTFLINTHKDKKWKINNPEKFGELYSFAKN